MRHLSVLTTAIVVTVVAATASPGAHLEHVLTFDESDLSVERRGGFDHITLAGCDLTRDVGKPQLPVLPLSLALPVGARVTGLEILSAESSELLRRFSPFPAQHPRILPVPGMDLPVPPTVGPDPEVYRSSRPYPSALAKLSSSGRIAGNAIVGITVYPVQFVPEVGKLRFFRSITLRLDYEIAEAGPELPGRTAELAETRILVANRHDVAERRSGLPAGARILDEGDCEHVIVVGNSSFEAAFAPLAEWKTRKGVPSTVVFESWIDATYPGADPPERLRNFIADARATWGTTWVLLAGDTDLVPARRAYAMTCEAGGHEDEDAIGCDLYYADLDGSWDADGDGTFGELDDGIDMYADVFVGRAPVRSTDDSDAFVAKLLEYEQASTTGHELDMLMAAEVLWTDPFTDSGIALNLIDREFVPPRFDPITKLYETLGNESGETVRAALNDGKGHFLHSGHAWYTVMGCGDGSIYRWEIFDLTNLHEQPLTYSIGCWPAAFDLDTDCIAERFLQSPNGGAVAFVGNSRYGWASPGNPGYGYSERFMQEFYRVLLVEELTNAGAALATARARFVPFSQQENVYRWHQYQLTLLGDPEMPVWTDVPSALTVSHPDSVVPGPQVFDVAVWASGAPVEDALVCVMNGSDVYERGRTGEDGAISLSVDTVLPDSLRVTVTAANRLPYENSVPVKFSGAFMRPTGHEIDDSVGGNGDGLPGPGETAELLLTLRNFGVEEAPAVEAQVSTDDLWVSVTQGQSSYGDVGGGESQVGSPPCELAIAEGCPDGHVALMNVTMTSAIVRTTWTGTIAVTVAAPVLEARSYAIDDAAGGDGDGLVEPGETVTTMVEIANEGSASAFAPLALLSTDDPWLVVTSGSATLSDVPAGASSQAVFEVQVLPGSPVPHFPSLLVETTTIDGIASSDTILITVGSAGFTDDFETGAPEWTHGGTSDLWNLTDNRWHSGTTSWYAGNPGSWVYADNMDAHLDSPEFVVAGNTELSFWCWYEFPIYHEDGFFVEVLAGGAAIDTLDFIGSGGALDALGSIGNDWLEYRYAIDGDTGDTLRIRFRFTSDETEVSEGVYLDDVSVTVSSTPEHTGVEDGVVSTKIHLYQNRPNPFSPSTSIRFATEAPGAISLSVYNIQGQLIRTLVQEHRGAGEHEVSWDGKDEFGVDVAAGVYLYRLTFDEQEETRKMILIR